MPGPKMGPRPPDFDEQVVRQSPTFARWEQMQRGEKLKYACREFIKGNGDDEERLMRRIMIARRNNVRDHQTLKRARELSRDNEENDDDELTAPPSKTSKKGNSKRGARSTRKRRPSSLFSDVEVAKQMDVSAVEATRSYRTWLEIPDGTEFVYNQKYIKGKEGHDWLLKKNIWRRMRYRRENKKMVEALRDDAEPGSLAFDGRSNPRSNSSDVASQIVDQALLNSHPPDHQDGAKHANKTKTDSSPDTGVDIAADQSSSDDFEVNAAVEAAVAVAESYAKSPYNVVHNPLDAAANSAALDADSAALDAAARLAAATTTMTFDAPVKKDNSKLSASTEV